MEGAKFPEYCEIDLSIATENLWLEAASLGLGAVWIGTAPLKERMEKVEAILRKRRNSRTGFTRGGYIIYENN